MSAVASRITSLMIAYSTVYSGRDKRKHKKSASLFSFDDIIMSGMAARCIAYFCTDSILSSANMLVSLLGETLNCKLHGVLCIWNSITVDWNTALHTISSTCRTGDFFYKSGNIFLDLYFIPCNKPHRSMILTLNIFECVWWKLKYVK